MYGIQRSLDKFRRALCSAFTSRCVFCGGAAPGGRCLCPGCEKNLVPAPGFPPAGARFSRFAAKYDYSGPARAALLCFKFSGDYRRCADTVFDWLLSAFDENFSGEEFDFIVPVPAFGGRRTRLYILARRLSHYRGVPCAPALLTKTRRTEKQHNLPAALRRTNLSGAFSAGEMAAGKRILLIDDVMTTGSTANECPAALLAAGAADVAVLTLLRTCSPENTEI